MKEPSLNVLGGPVVSCSREPMTGWFRDGCCNTNDDDIGNHTICGQVTAEFLAYSKASGNDLSTPRPEFGFAGLEPGDRWCICAGRWLEAFQEGMACPVYLEGCHRNALRVVPLEALLSMAIAPTA